MALGYSWDHPSFSHLLSRLATFLHARVARGPNLRHSAKNRAFKSPVNAKREQGLVLYTHSTTHFVQ